MINALEVFIQFLKGAGLSTSKVASKHRYGSPWAAGESAIVARLDDGSPNVYLEVTPVRIEVRCYAASDVEALDLVQELIELSRSTVRVEQVVEGGTGLLYYFNPASGPSLVFDPDLNMDFALMFFNALVSEKGV